MNTFIGGLVAVSVRSSSGGAVFMVKELAGLDDRARLLYLKQYRPNRIRVYRMVDILRLYLVDDVQREIEFV